jgi:hypothetical protein
VNNKTNDDRMIELLEKINANIDILSKITVLTLRKEALFKGKDTKQEQIEVLEDLKLPDNVIALVIGSTVDSIQVLRSQRKAKVKNTQKIEPAKKEEEKKDVKVKQ